MSVDFKLRPWSKEDLPSLVNHANNPKIANNLSDGFPHPFTEENGKRFLKIFVESETDLFLCIDVNGEAVGSIGIHSKKDVHRKNAEIGYWLAEPFWGQGILSRAIPQAVNLAFEKFDITKVLACPYGENRGSQRVLEKCGFVLEARLKDNIFKNGRYQDELIYTVNREKWENS
ncbi:MAG: GNAT family N-acetyltransferase [Flavobacteriales bacterium]